MSCRFQFTDRARFIASSLSNVVKILAEKIHRIKFKYEHNDKKCETCEIKYNICDCCHEYANLIQMI